MTVLDKEKFCIKVNSEDDDNLAIKWIKSKYPNDDIDDSWPIGTNKNGDNFWSFDHENLEYPEECYNHWVKMDTEGRYGGLEVISIDRIKKELDDAELEEKRERK